MFHKFRADMQSYGGNATDGVLEEFHEHINKNIFHITKSFSFAVLSAHIQRIEDFVFLYPSFFESLRGKSDGLIFQFDFLQDFNTIDHTLRIALATLEFVRKYQFDPDFKIPQIIINLNHALSVAQQTQLMDATLHISKITVQINARNFNFTNSNEVYSATNETTRLLG